MLNAIAKPRYAPILFTVFLYFLDSHVINHRETRRTITRFPVAWGDWMVPELGPEQLLTLERQRRVIAGYSVEEAREQLWRLCQLATHQDIMLRGAVKRVAELELSIELGVAPAAATQESTASEPEASEAPAQGLGHVPWPIRVLRLVAALRAG